MEIKPNILVVCARQRDHVALQLLDSDYRIHFLDIDLNTRFNSFNFDILRYLDEAADYIDKHKIDGIFFASDVGSIIAAILCEKFALPGPSLESAFLCYHKYYTRQHFKSPICYRALDIEELQSLDPSPGYYLKAPTSALGVLGFTIRNEDDLALAISISEGEIQAMTQSMVPLFEKYLNRDKYPYAFLPIMVLEELLEGEQITLEGYVRAGEIDFTVITDTNTFPGSCLIDNFSLPSALNDEMHERIFDRARGDIENLNLDNSFFNIEYFVSDDSLELIEINCRACFAFYRLYKETYGLDIYRAALELCLGKKPDIVLNLKQCGAQFNLTTQKEGPVENFFDHGRSIRYGYNIFVKPGEEIYQRSEYGVVMAQLEIYGESYEQIKAAADIERGLLLKVDPLKQDRSGEGNVESAAPDLNGSYIIGVK